MRIASSEPDRVTLNTTSLLSALLLTNTSPLAWLTVKILSPAPTFNVSPTNKSPLTSVVTASISTVVTSISTECAPSASPFNFNTWSSLTLNNISPSSRLFLIANWDSEFALILRSVVPNSKRL